MAGISPSAQIYLDSTATPLALPAPWHLHRGGGGRGSRCYFSLMGDPSFQRWPVAVWLGNDFLNQYSYNGGGGGGEMSQAASWGPSPGPVSQGVNLAPI